jgi:ATP-dependent Lhr-like helicase
VIVDEIHALVPTKRGAHLALSIERIQMLRDPQADRLLQRIGLSATQRPLDEVARFLGGREPQQPRASKPERRKVSTRTGAQTPSPLASADPDDVIHDEFSAEGPETAVYRPVTIVDTSEKKRLDLTIEVPVGEELDLDGDPPAPARAGAVASVDADLRQQPPDRGTTGRSAQ